MKDYTHFMIIGKDINGVLMQPTWEPRKDYPDRVTGFWADPETKMLPLLVAVVKCKLKPTTC